MLIEQLDETSMFEWGRRFIKYKDNQFSRKRLDSELNLNKHFLFDDSLTIISTLKYLQ